MGVKSQISTQIRVMRKSRNMTQEDLAKAIDQSPSSITMYETGRRVPSFETLEAISDVFNVPLEGLIGYEYHLNDPDVLPEIPETNAPQTVEARILARGIDKLPKEQREQALNVIKAMFAKYADYFYTEDEDDDA